MISAPCVLLLAVFCRAQAALQQQLRSYCWVRRRGWCCSATQQESAKRGCHKPPPPRRRPWQGRVGVSLGGYSEFPLDELVDRTVAVARTLQ